MANIWEVAMDGDWDQVKQRVEQDPGLLSAKDEGGHTLLMEACQSGHDETVVWLVDKGAAINERDDNDLTALWLACDPGSIPAVRLLMERGADPTITDEVGNTPLMIASTGGNLVSTAAEERTDEGRVEVVRLLLEYPSTKSIINNRDGRGETALFRACEMGLGGIVRVLLASGADPTIADNKGMTPMAIASKRRALPLGATIEGRRECVAVLEVRSCLLLCPPIRISSLGRRVMPSS
jgi:ankyrin repeat protein